MHIHWWCLHGGALLFWYISILYLIAQQHKWLPANQPLHCTHHLFPYLPNSRSSASLSFFCWICFILPTSLFLLSLSTSKKLKTHTDTLVWTHKAMCSRVLFLVLPVLSTSNLLKTQNDLFDSLKKIRQPLNTLKRWELRGAQWRSNSFIIAVTYRRRLDSGGGRRWLGGKQIERRQEKEKRQNNRGVWGGGFKKVGRRRIILFFLEVMFICTAFQKCWTVHVQEKHEQELEVSLD